MNHSDRQRLHRALADVMDAMSYLNRAARRGQTPGLSMSQVYELSERLRHLALDLSEWREAEDQRFDSRR